jgi:hypothetical protein
MYNELKGRTAQNASKTLHRVKQEKERQQKPTIDICGISAAAFWLNLQKENNIFFATSMFEIDRELKARAPEVYNLESSLKDARQLGETELH